MKCSCRWIEWRGKW